MFAKKNRRMQLEQFIEANYSDEFQCSVFDCMCMRIVPKLVFITLSNSRMYSSVVEIPKITSFLAHKISTLPYNSMVLLHIQLTQRINFTSRKKSSSIGIELPKSM